MENNANRRPRVLIVGGGFAGVRLALTLSKQKVPAEIFLIDPKFHFEYHSTLYRAVTGGSVMEACIAYDDIFKGTDVVIEKDTVTKIDTTNKTVKGKSGSDYHYDYLVIAVGAEANYFGIPGLEEHTFSFKTIRDALKLRRHIESLFINLKDADSGIKEASANIVIVGGGAMGVEIAGQIVSFAKGLAKENGIDPSMLTIDMIEAKDRVMPLLREKASKKVEARLRKLGVNIFLNRTVTKEDVEEIHMKSMDMHTKTVVWTAGVKSNDLYKENFGSICDRRGSVEVDEHFMAKNLEGVYVIGDGAQAKFGGMAQTADREAEYLGKILSVKIKGQDVQTVAPYVPKEPAYAIPVGENWAVMQWGNMLYSGYIGYILRRIVDLKYFLSILPITKAWRAFRQGRVPVSVSYKKTVEAVEVQIENADKTPKLQNP